MLLSQMNRTDLEIAFLETDLKNSCAEVLAMSDEELRALIGAWIEAGDECANA